MRKVSGTFMEQSGPKKYPEAVRRGSSPKSQVTLGLPAPLLFSSEYWLHSLLLM